VTPTTALRAHATALRDRRPLPAVDPAVPQLPALLDGDGMGAVLARSLTAGATIDDVRVTLVEYRPGCGATVVYDVATGGESHVAVASSGQAIAAGAARTDARRAILRALGAHSPAARPLTYDAGLGALVQWYPLDLAMPVLSRPLPELLRLVSRAGVGSTATADAPARTLVYRPGRRAVLRAGDLVLKAYADDAAFRAGVGGLRIASGLSFAGAPAQHGALADVRLTVQPALDGIPVPRERAREVAPVAGAMLRVLHDAPIPGLEPAPPRYQLEGAARAAGLAAAVAPHLARRVWRIVARLADDEPQALATAPSHGDFNISQLLDVDGAYALLDFDEACLAAPALDVAAYAANLVSGRPGDLERADAALDALLEGYGPRPPALDWHYAAALLRRAPSPFRLHKKRWTERLESIVAAAEEVLAR
jgi:hypothetical protein